MEILGDMILGIGVVGLLLLLVLDFVVYLLFSMDVEENVEV